MIFAGIKKDKSIIKKKKKHDKIILLGKEKLSSIEVLISKALIDSYISHDVFVSANNVLIKKVWVIKKIMETYCVSWKKILQTRTDEK